MSNSPAWVHAQLGSRKTAVRLPDLAHIDSLTHRLKVPAPRRQGRAAAATTDNPTTVPDARHANLFLAYLHEQDESTAELSLYNDIDYEPCPPWDFAYTNNYVLSDDIKAVDKYRKEVLGWPLPVVKEGEELKQGSIRGCSCGDGDDASDECDPETCQCRKLLERIDRFFDDKAELKGRFAYGPDGRLHEDGAMGYLGLSIFECTDACGCGDDCPNRVVQKGRTVPLEIFKTAACGWGVRAREYLKAGTFVINYPGELLTNSEAERRTVDYESRLRTTYICDVEPYLAEEWSNKPDMEAWAKQPDNHKARAIIEQEGSFEALGQAQLDELMDLWQREPSQEDRYLSVDAGPWGNLSRYFNHSCRPNMTLKYVYTDKCFDVHRPIMAFFTNVDCHEGTELTFSYNEQAGDEGEVSTAKERLDRDQSVDAVPLQAGNGDAEGSLWMMRCHCGHEECVGAMFTRDPASIRTKSTAAAPPPFIEPSVPSQQQRSVSPADGQSPSAAADATKASAEEDSRASAKRAMTADPPSLSGTSANNMSPVRPPSKRPRLTAPGHGGTAPAPSLPSDWPQKAGTGTMSQPFVFDSDDEDEDDDVGPVHAPAGPLFFASQTDDQDDEEEGDQQDVVMQNGFFGVFPQTRQFTLGLDIYDSQDPSTGAAPSPAAPSADDTAAMIASLAQQGLNGGQHQAGAASGADPADEASQRRPTAFGSRRPDQMDETQTQQGGM